jgi:hypothetical protein
MISILVRALTVPMHLGLISGPFVPHNLISAEGSPVPCYSSRWPPDLTFNALWVQEKGTQISIFFFSQNSQYTNHLQVPQQGPYRKTVCLRGLFLHISQIPYKNFPK